MIAKNNTINRKPTLRLIPASRSLDRFFVWGLVFDGGVILGASSAANQGLFSSVLII